MASSFQIKCDLLKKKFALLTQEERYDALIEMGRKLPPFPIQFQTPDFIVSGCQSVLYLHAYESEGNLFFEARADALISAGLAALLIAIYSGETPEIILTSPPHFIVELGISNSLSFNRSNGFASIYLRIKQESLKFLCSQSKID